MDAVVSIIISVISFILVLFLVAIVWDSVIELIRLIHWTGKGLLRGSSIGAWITRGPRVTLVLCSVAFWAIGKYVPDFANRLTGNWGFKIGVLISAMILCGQIYALIKKPVQGRKKGVPHSVWLYAAKYIRTDAGRNMDARRKILADQAMGVLLMGKNLKVQAPANQIARQMFRNIFEMGGDNHGADLVAEKLSQEESELKLAGIEALGKCEGGGAAIKSLLAMIRDDNHSVAKAAVKALVSLDYSPAGRSELMAFALALEQWDEIGKFGTDSVDGLLSILKDDRNPSRKLAAKALGRIGEARSVEPLLAALKDKDVEIRKEALWALGTMKEPRAVNALVAALGDKSAGAIALEMLVGFGSAAVDPLLSALQAGNKDTQEHAAEALGKIGDARAVEGLSRLLDQTASRKAAEALARIGDERAIGILTASLKHKQTVAQESAVEALELIAGDRPDIRELLKQREAERQVERELLDKQSTREVIVWEERRWPEAAELRGKIRIGMRLGEAIAVLGPPSRQIGGGDVLRAFGRVSGSAAAIASISGRQYYTWQRPEGIWELVFVNESLVNIQSAP